MLDNNLTINRNGKMCYIYFVTHMYIQRIQDKIK